MERRSFTGKWITAEEFSELEPIDVFHRQLEKKDIHGRAKKNSHLLFRSEFYLSASEKVKIYISADDYYKLYINGRFVCQGPAPGYPFHYYYNMVDISEYVKAGKNIIAVHTYYQGLINRVWVSGDDRHGLILDIEHDGKVILSSNESFLCAYHEGFEAIGICGYDTQFLERYNSGTGYEGFEKTEYCCLGKAWKHARVKRVADYQLYLQPTKMLSFEQIEPVKVFKDDTGITVDFGKTYVGYMCAKAQGNNGDLIEFLYGQELCDEHKDGRIYDENSTHLPNVRWNLRANCDYKEEWILSGRIDTLNQFDYKSFRYVRINLPKECKLEHIYLNARHYPFELIAKPDKEMINRYPKLIEIWDLCINTLRYGVQEVIQDCMEREKGNYLGDGCYTALAYTMLTGDASVFKKLIDDSLRSRFIDGGLMTCATCSFMQEIAEYPLMMYYALYTYYELTGDIGYLEEKYEQLADVLDYFRDNYSEISREQKGSGLLTNLDKWCVVEWPANYRDGYDVDITEGKVCTEIHNVINAHYLGAIKYMNLIAKALGKPEYCDELPLLKAFNEAFYDYESKLFKDSITTSHISLIANVFPLMYGLYEDKETENAILKLVENRGFTSVMLFGAYPILAGLKRIGRKDLMIKYLLDEGAWLRMLSEGATTTFEGWGKDCKWNTSLFHLTLSYAVMFIAE